VGCRDGLSISLATPDHGEEGEIGGIVSISASSAAPSAASKPDGVVGLDQPLGRRAICA